MTGFSETLALHPFVRQVVADKVRGAIVGSALGDCVGLYTEFLNKAMSRDAYPDGKFVLTGNVTPFCRDSHRNKFSEGSWTDDTDHSLLVILAYLHGNGENFSSFEFAKRLRSWIKQGLRCLDRLPLGLGQNTGAVVTRKSYLDNPKASAYRSWMNSNFTSAPNGSLMRTYPLGIVCLDKSINKSFEMSTDLCLVTHADYRCVVSCCIGTTIIRALLLGEIQKEADIDLLVDKAADYVESWSVQARPEEQVDDVPNLDPTGLLKSPPAFDRAELYTHTRAKSYTSLELDDLRKLGYVYKCLGSSIFCLRLAMRRISTTSQVGSTTLRNRDIFEELITDLVMEGGDADTNGAVAGAFLGCYLGFSLLPPHWYHGMQNVEWLLTKADALIQVLDIDECAMGYVGSKDPDTEEDGGKGFLNIEQLKAREMAFMEMYLKKTINKTSHAPQNNTGPSLLKRWKDVFG